MNFVASTAARSPNPSNRLGLDYAAEAARLPLPAGLGGIVDVHTHINGERAARIYQRAAKLYGISLTYSMTQLEQVPMMRAIFGDAIRFIAVPNWAGVDKKFEMGQGFLDRIRMYHESGCRIVKFWAAPRSLEIAQKMGDASFARLDSPLRIEAMKLASDLGMIFMTHVGDPDTWFATKYADAALYGTKRSQYEPLEILLDRFTQPWIAAHMGGSPEDLEFLAGLLDRHPNLYVDTSAAKWMIRAFGRHPRKEVLDFLTRFRGRVMFGSDIVSTDEHLTHADDKMEMAAKASDAEQAFDLYASRYWALRTMWETEYRGDSPIADPDLKMVEPEKYDDMSAPPLVGMNVPRELLQSLYHGASDGLLGRLHEQ
jgi:hypothetical protein